MIIVRDEVVGLAAFVLWQTDSQTEEQALASVRQALQENRDATPDVNSAYDPAAEMLRVLIRAREIAREH